MFENAFNNIDRALRNDEGLASELDAPLLAEPYRWQRWAAPKQDGKLDHNAALTGADLIDFVNRDLFRYLRGFSQTTAGPDSLEYKIGETFSEIVNMFRSGYSLRHALEIVNQLDFGSTQA